MIYYQGISVFTNQAVDVCVQAEKIVEITSLQISYELPYIAPGFFDMQVNGYKGSDYSLEEFSEEHLQKIIAHLAASGTTQHLPTLVTGPRERMLQTLRIISTARRHSADIAAAIPGIHIEGPYISSEDGPRGAHDPAYIRDPDAAEFEQWQEAADGKIALVTIAPEKPGALDFIKYITACGVVAAIGHTAADPVTIRQAIAAGAKLSTHLGNGSHGLLPRLKNYLWEQLAADELMASIIADGFHLPSSMLKVISRAKRLDKLILVSDAALVGGFEPGIYQWGSLDVQVFEDGHLGLPGTEFLAGAAHLLDWDIPHFMNATGYDLASTLPLCTTNPAKILQGTENLGAFAIGAPANLVLFTFQPGDERLTIEKTIRAGKEIFVK
ncbi:N-acetylglucosamine-6-phosphate deacetylase [Candidatus Vecturithrix granuli]|uniref:N-acetylglucosamine-6-phosphate deacetylase n=1 Tax=Vecturithrix granuli TaxID=1499967 RepID=A0A0S6WA79_VECG1|nr:N-acetylglucosamine-6-phosphate deacetylase [Candidatus Vecturithrix granuli]